MVSMIEDFQKFIVNRKQVLLDVSSIESYCYFYLINSFTGDVERLILDIPPDGLPLEEEYLARLGYISGFEKEASSSVNDVSIRRSLEQVLNTKPLSGMHYSSNIYTLLGIYLLSNRLALEDSGLQSHVEKVLKGESLKDKFLISVPKKQFENIVDIDSCHTLADCLINYLIGTLRNDFFRNKKKLSDNIIRFWDHSVFSSLDLIDIFLIEYWLTYELKGSMLYKEHNSFSLIKEILANFSNSITKVTRNRRKDHPPFVMNDEYDVQDLIYLMLKPIFKDLKEEDHVPKTGGKSTRIDLVIPSEDIVIETKMIKVNDTNEDRFVKEIKEDIQSYYKYPNLKWLIVFVYDPLNKTRDDNNFYDLSGNMKIKEKEFEVFLIVAH